MEMFVHSSRASSNQAELNAGDHAISDSLLGGVLAAAATILLGQTNALAAEVWMCPECHQEELNKPLWKARHQATCPCNPEPADGLLRFENNEWLRLQRLEKILDRVQKLEEVPEIVRWLLQQRCFSGLHNLWNLTHAVHTMDCANIPKPYPKPYDDYWFSRKMAGRPQELQAELKRCHTKIVAFENCPPDRRGDANAMSAELGVACTNGERVVQRCSF